jgi:hypothetical protein
MIATDRSCVIRLVEAQARIPDSANKRSVRVLQRGTLDAVLGTPASPDEQATHEQDEAYIVVRGRGILFHDDSALAVAAVHAGALQPGKTGTVRVTIVGIQPNFQSSVRNGVMSGAWGQWTGFRVEVGKGGGPNKKD